MNTFRSMLSTLALAALAATGVHAQTTTEPAPADTPSTMPAEVNQTAPAPAPAPAQAMPEGGQLSTPQQDRGAMAGTAGEAAARQQAMEAKAAREAARWGKDGGVHGELSVPHQDRGGYAGMGVEPPSANWKAQ